MLVLKAHINNLLTFDHSELDELLDKFFEACETGDAEQTYRWLDIFWARLAMHIRAEHLHLFPAIIRIAESLEIEDTIAPSIETVKETISNLQDDHNFFMREITSAIKHLREIREGQKRNTARELSEVRVKMIAVKDRLEKHNEIEEAEVYEWADSLLPMVERPALSEKLKKEITNLPPRFKKDNG